VSRAELDVETLLSNAQWLRRLARGLGGEGEADDLIQDTWMAALRSPPDPRRPVRPWLAEVVRNLVRMGRRRSARRPPVVTSELDGVAGAAASTDDLLASLELQRRLATLVWELEEPYRASILLRFYEGLDSPAIAGRLGVPAGTVRWRLSEGVRRLRERLDDGRGQRRAMLLVAGGHRPVREGLLWWGAIAAGAAACAWLAVRSPLPSPLRRGDRQASRGPAGAEGRSEPPRPGRSGPSLAAFLGAGLPALIAAASEERPYTRDELIDDCLFHREKLIACPEVAANDWLRGWKREWLAKHGPPGPSTAEIARFRQDRLDELAAIAAIPAGERRDRCAERVDGTLARGDELAARAMDERWHECVADPDCQRASDCARAVFEAFHPHAPR
jgi:RNA polymerase sigma-70 factor (ECF subfamily)